MWWWSAVRLVVVGATVALVLYGVDRVVEVTTRRLPARAGNVPRVLRGCRRPILAVTGCGLLLAAMPWVRAPDGIGHLLVLATIGSCAWLAARAAALVLDGRCGSRCGAGTPPGPGGPAPRWACSAASSRRRSRCWRWPGC
ncbi:hypothetical protein [Kitasatospora fiedleri]|uniref:hypothetical protein n=1 Tax=Kitasatospora fiedleri TaxID=2991545 RepID=UPI00249A28E0|nr:hypothetical protein [Kitasatospora fiedleri]